MFQKECKSANRIFLVLIIISAALNLLTLKNGHNWGGDFAQYIIHAQNLISQRPFNAGIMLENPFQYPPGFAFLLAPLIKIFGVNFIVLKLPNIFYWYATIGLLFLMYRPHLGNDLALLSSLVLAFSSSFFCYKQNVLSDLPFLFFITLAFYLFQRYCDNKEKIRLNDRSFLVFLAVLVLAYLIRTAGVIVFFAMAMYLIVMKRNWIAVAGILAAYALAVCIQNVFVGVGPSFFSVVAEDPLKFLTFAAQRAFVPFQSLFLIFSPAITPLTGQVYGSAQQVIALGSVFVWMILLGTFIHKLIHRKLTPVGLFIYLYLVACLFWAGFEANANTFARILFPVAAFVLMSFLVYIKEKKLFTAGKVFLSLLLLLNIYNIAGNINFNDDVLFKRQNQELFTWVKENLDPKDHYTFWSPRAVALMTERVGASPAKVSAKEFTDLVGRLVPLKIGYVITIKKNEQPLIAQMGSAPELFQMVWENEYYKIFRLKVVIRD